MRWIERTYSALEKWDLRATGSVLARQALFGPVRSTPS